MKENPFNVMKAEYPELYEWLKEISRYSEVENFSLPDYKDEMYVFFYTHDYRYNIRTRLPIKNGKKMFKTNKVLPSDYPEKGYKEGDKGYLGCTVIARKSRAGEDWVRGNDLADGKYCKETWEKIKNNIISYELVKIVKPNAAKPLITKTITTVKLIMSLILNLL